MHSRHTPMSAGMSEEHESSPTRGRRDSHVRQACDECQRRKRKCDDINPCGRCVKLGLQCQRTRLDQRLATTQAARYNDPGFNDPSPFSTGCGAFPAAPHPGTTSSWGNRAIRRSPISTTSSDYVPSYTNGSEPTPVTQPITPSYAKESSLPAYCINYGGGPRDALPSFGTYPEPTMTYHAEASAYPSEDVRLQPSFYAYTSPSHGPIEGDANGQRRANPALIGPHSPVARLETHPGFFASYAHPQGPAYLPSLPEAPPSDGLARRASEEEGHSQASRSYYEY